MVEQSQIEGRGGAAMTYLGTGENLSHEFLLSSGASRERQFDDFWKISVGLGQQGRTIAKQKIEITERDDFTARNAMTAITRGKKVYLFGGQDSEKSVLFNQMYELDLETKALKQIE